MPTSITKFYNEAYEFEMTTDYTKLEALKYAAQECKDIRGLPPSWYDFDTLAITYGIGHTDAMFVAAASPDAILALIAERDALRLDLIAALGQQLDAAIAAKEAK